jgi:hypothetical protein
MAAAEGQPVGSPWPVLAVLAALAAAWSDLFACTPDPAKWPLAALEVVNRQDPSALMFHEQDWGGLIEEECRPRRKAFLDDRFELWGRAPILEYLSALEGGPGWDAIERQDPIALVWLRPDRGLATRLAEDPGWSILHQDRVSVVFRRAGGIAKAGDRR